MAQETGRALTAQTKSEIEKRGRCAKELKQFAHGMAYASHAVPPHESDTEPLGRALLN